MGNQNNLQDSGNRVLDPWVGEACRASQVEAWDLWGLASAADEA